MDGAARAAIGSWREATGSPATHVAAHAAARVAIGKAGKEAGIISTKNASRPVSRVHLGNFVVLEIFYKLSLTHYLWDASCHFFHKASSVPNPLLGIITA